MIGDHEFEWAQDLPSGLCVGRLNGAEIRIAAISPRALIARTPDALDASGALQLYFYRPDQGGYQVHTLKAYSIGQARRKNGAVLTRFCFDDPACAASIRRMLNSYARFLEIRSEEGASAYAAAIAAYPAEADACFANSPAEDGSAWLAALPPLPPMPKACALAVELNCSELWQLYLHTPIADFASAYARARHLPNAWQALPQPNRFYIGNPFCRHVFPDAPTLRAIAAKAHSEGIALSLVTAELRIDSAPQADHIAAFAQESGAELVVNDWGMLHRVQWLRGELKIALGSQLNRRRKDPRLPYKRGLENRCDLLARNGLNDAAWLAFLQDLGVARLEYESCGVVPILPSLPCSLHLPFYQTNTGLWCPLKAVCERGSRGAQQGANACSAWCDRNALIYPDHLKLIGRWNSLLALDLHCNAAAELQGFDRWVLNF